MNLGTFFKNPGGVLLNETIDFESGYKSRSRNGKGVFGSNLKTKRTDGLTSDLIAKRLII